MADLPSVCNYLQEVNPIAEEFRQCIWQNIPMITAGTDTGVNIDLGKDEPGMVLQRRERGQDWRNYLINRRLVKSPVDIETLPAGKYRLV